MTPVDTENKPGLITGQSVSGTSPNQYKYAQSVDEVKLWWKQLLQEQTDDDSD